MNVPSLWPELHSDSRTTPLGILRSQAQWLHKKTSGLLWGDIQTEGGAGEFVHRFFVVVPALGDFRHELFSMTQGINYYPVWMRPAGDTPQPRSALHTEQELVDWLKNRFEQDKPLLDRLYTDSLPNSEPAIPGR